MNSKAGIAFADVAGMLRFWILFIAMAVLASLPLLAKAEEGEEQIELRVALTHSGFELLRRELKEEFQPGSPRTDYYFDVYQDRSLVFRADPTLPTKIRIKEKETEDGRGYTWQVSRRIHRAMHKTDGVPVTLTRLVGQEQELKTSKAQSIIMPGREFLWATLDHEKKLAQKAYNEFEAAARVIPGFEGSDVFTPTLDNGGKFVPIIVNTKQRWYLPKNTKIGGFRMNIIAGAVTYWTSENQGQRFFEFEAELEGGVDEAEQLEAIEALAEFIKDHGLKPKDFYTKGSGNHCELVIDGLKKVFKDKRDR